MTKKKPSESKSKGDVGCFQTEMILDVSHGARSPSPTGATEEASSPVFAKATKKEPPEIKPSPSPPGTYNGDDPAEQAAADRRLSGKFTAEDDVIIDKWVNAQSYSELVDLNRQFLRGELPFSCYHLGPIFSETKPILPALLHLHDFGMLTLQSQPAKTIVDHGPGADGKMTWHKIYHRPYLSFFIPQNCGRVARSRLRKFLVELVVDDAMYASIVNVDGRCRNGGCFRKPRVVSSFPDGWSSHHAQHAENEEDLDTPKAATAEKQGFDDDCVCFMKSFGSGAEMSVLEMAKPLVIHILAKDWHEQDLAGKVEKIATRIGMEGVYAEGFE